MDDLNSPQKWFKIVFQITDEEGPSVSKDVLALSVDEAIQKLKFSTRKQISVLYAWESIKFELPNPDWERNVQYMRVEFPPFTDEQQDKLAVELAKEIEELLTKKLAAIGPRGMKYVVSLGGFYRGDMNWDNVDEPKMCVNSPTRGSGENEP
jgi:hypothetical protein